MRPVLSLIAASVITALGTGLPAPARAAEPAAAAQPAHIRVQVPADAEIWFDGAKTNQTGSSREFVSPPLRPGRVYTYQVHVRCWNDGRAVEEDKRLDVHSGDTARLNFGAPAERRSFDSVPGSGYYYPAYGGSSLRAYSTPGPDWGLAPRPDYEPYDYRDYMMWAWALGG